jgi:hypothetical protein
VVEPAMRDTLSTVWGWRNVVLGTWPSVRGSRNLVQARLQVRF